MKQQEKKLNNRQWRLYVVLREAAIVRPGEWITKEEICETLSPDYPRHLEIVPDEYGRYPIRVEDIKLRSEHNSSAFRKLRADIKAINNDSDRVQKIILSSSKGYRLAIDDQEVRDAMERRRIAALKRLKAASTQIEKASQDGQCRLKIDGVGREYYEAFVRGENNGK